MWILGSKSTNGNVYRSILENVVSFSLMAGNQEVGEVLEEFGYLLAERFTAHRMGVGRAWWMMFGFRAGTSHPARSSSRALVVD
jgi:hypothetical protein